MIRLLLLLLAILVAMPRAGAAEPPPPLSADQARAALEVLNDPQKRAAFAATLQAIAAAQGSAPLPTQAEALEPGSLGAQILWRVNASMHILRNRIEAAVGSVQSVPLLWAWLVVMATDPIGHTILSGVGWRLLLAAAAAAAAGGAVHIVLRPARRRLENALLTERTSPEDRAEQGDIESPNDAIAPPSVGTRKPWLILARFSLRLVPVLALLVAGHLVALAADGSSASGLVIEAVLEAATLTLMLTEVARILLSPGESRLRPLALSDRAAGYLMRWTQRLTTTAVAGYATAEVGVLLGLSDPGHDALIGTTGLLVTGGLIVMILTQRRSVRQALRAAAGSKDPIARIQNTIAKTWHWLAFLGLATLWFAWAVDVSVSGLYAAQLAGSILLVLAGTKLALMVSLGMIDRLPAFGELAGQGFPGLDDRVRFYHPALSATVRWTIYVLAALALSQILGSGSLYWLLSSQGGQRVLSGLLTLASTILVAVMVWELTNAAIQRHLNRLQQEAQLARSARLRTLLPMLRTSLLIAIGVVTVLMVLSEIGVNIAPLLAGAGIMGVAIGFGSQKLVQDLITGIFLLLENAVQVGDWVNAAGLSGKVEGLSVRTIRLRAIDGALHIVPFSSVGSVTNFTKGLGNADVRATVDFGTDTDLVAEIMSDIVAEMRGEPAFQTKILQDFSLWGVDKISADGVTVVGQVACTDSGRWSVQREVNRRIKQRFEAAGIQFFAPAFGLPATGSTSG